MIRFRNARSPRRLALTLAALAVITPASVARAAEPTPNDVRLARAMERSAILDLGLHDSPTRSDYALTAGLLSLASDLDPTDAELARSVVEAAWQAGDQELMHDATRRVIRLDPKDTVAQLRLISAMVGEKQTVEERLAFYDRFLGPQGRSLDRSVRSRLSLDAALLERERGNAAGFSERLHQATRLDMSNKAAASLAAQHHASRSGDPVMIFERQLVLLNADPLDPHVHMTIARLLVAQGSHAASRRFLTNAVQLFKLETGRAPAEIEETRIAMDWQIDGPQEITESLGAVIRDRRTEARSRLESYRELQLPTDDLPRPEEIRFGLGIDKLRLLAAHSMDDREQTRSVLDDIEATVAQDLQTLGALAQRRGVDVNAVLTEVVNKVADLQVMRAIVGLEADQIRKDIDTIVENQPRLAPSFASIEPMALYAEGRYEEALEASEPFSDSAVIALIRGQILEKLDRREEAIETYSAVARARALDAYGAFALSRLKSLGAGDRVVTAAGRQMAQVAQTVPDWIDQMIQRPESFMFLDVKPGSGAVSLVEAPTLIIRLKNTAPIPLALGPNHPINSSFLIAPKLDQMSDFRGDGYAKVVRLDHRLRLEPLEELEVEIDADSSQTQWLLLMQPDTTMRQRWRALQGFQPRVSDSVLSNVDAASSASIYGINASPLGLTDETEIVQRSMLQTTQASVDELVSMLGADEADRRRGAIIATAGRLLLPPEGEEPDAGEQRRLISAIMDAYTRARAKERTWMMLVLPHRHQVPAMIDFDDHVASTALSDALIDSIVDPYLLAAALLTRTDDPQAPIFETLTQISDERVERIADIVRERLRDGRETTATVGPGVGGMIPRMRADP